jgi:phenylalanyl-tRNA synthetase beta chain
VTENSGSASKLSVTAPQHRVDIQHGPADMVEDVARIYGYDKLPTSSLADALPVQWDNVALLGEERIRDILAGLGLQEVMTYTLTAPEKEQPLGITGSAVTLANPIHSERGILRRSLLASVLQVASSNLKQHNGVRFFEIGQVYLPVDGAVLPQEIRRLSIVITGPRTTEHWDSQTAVAAMDFFDLKGIVQALLSRLHSNKVSFEPVQTTELHPGQSASIKIGGIEVGKLGQLHPSLLASYELGRRKVYVADIDVDALLAIVPSTHQLGTISTFPPMLEDIALVVDEALSAAKLEAELRAGGGELLRQVKLFDVYRGANLPEGKKSLAFALTYQAPDRSLTDKEVSKVRAKIIGRVEKLLGATLRA